MLLMIDNYDSFTYNLYQYLCGLGAEVEVVRNDKISLEEIEDMSPEGIIISPASGAPTVNRNDLGAAHLAFFVEDLDRFYEETSEQGLRYNNPPATQCDDEGKVLIKACYAQDPDGNWLEFVETF